MRAPPLQAQPHAPVLSAATTIKGQWGAKTLLNDAGPFRSVIHKVYHSISESTDSDDTWQRCQSMPLSCPSRERHDSAFWLVVGFPSSRWLIAVVQLCCCCYKLDPSQTL
ncbi:hypothetical protein HDV63DRAFT_192213 [Trichoderma sp. SZMC 28014]